MLVSGTKIVGQVTERSVGCPPKQVRAEEAPILDAIVVNYLHEQKNALCLDGAGYVGHVLFVCGLPCIITTVTSCLCLQTCSWTHQT